MYVLYVCMHLCVFMYVCMHVCVYVCMYVCIYVCMYIDSIFSVPGIGNSGSAYRSLRVPSFVNTFKVLNTLNLGYTVATRSYAIGGICWRKENATCWHVSTFRLLKN